MFPSRIPTRFEACEPIRRGTFTALGLALVLSLEPACTVLNRLIPIQSAPPEISKAGFRLPCDGPLTSTFGMRTLLGTTRMHKGIDFGGEKWVGPIFAAADGVVTISQTSETYGEWIEIRHAGGYSTRYAHMTWRHVSAGDEVKQGDVIGRFGSTGRSTGTHLHFEILRNGVQVDPLPLVPRVSRAGASSTPQPEPEEPGSSPDSGGSGNGSTQPAPTKGKGSSKKSGSGAAKPAATGKKSGAGPSKPGSGKKDAQGAPGETPGIPPAAAPAAVPPAVPTPAPEASPAEGPGE